MEQRFKEVEQNQQSFSPRKRPRSSFEENEFQGPSTSSTAHSGDRNFEDSEEELEANLEMDEHDNWSNCSEEEEEEIYQSAPAKAEKNLTPKFIFKKTQVHEIYSSIASISPPTSKYSSFTLNISNRISRLIKGIQEHPTNPTKFDIVSQDSTLNKIFDHANTKYVASDIPEDCFKIPTAARSSLQNAYKALSRHQQSLKSAVLAAELAKDKFKTEDDQEAQELVRIYILPIENQIINIHETIRRIRAISIPKYIPPSIKKNLIAAPILPNSIWNISSQMQNRISSTRNDFFKKLSFKRQSNYYEQRDSRPFSSRGRGFDRRSRPQSKGGPFKRNNSDSKFEHSKQDRSRN